MHEELYEELDNWKVTLKIISKLRSITFLLTPIAMGAWSYFTRSWITLGVMLFVMLVLWLLKFPIKLGEYAARRWEDFIRLRSDYLKLEKKQERGTFREFRGWVSGFGKLGMIGSMVKDWGWTCYVFSIPFEYREGASKEECEKLSEDIRQIIEKYFTAAVAGRNLEKVKALLD